MTWLLKGGRVVDPAAGIDEVLDVLIVDGTIAAVGPDLSTAPPVAGRQTLDCTGKVVAPGLIDTGARLGEPGFEHRETMASAARAAAAGGFAAVCALPATDPVVDEPGGVRFVVETGASAAVRVFPMAAATRRSMGEQLVEVGLLKRAGAVALVDEDGIQDAAVLRRVLEYARMFDMLVVERPNDAALAGQGVMHEGTAATVRGLKGIPAAAEDVAVARGVILAEMTGARLHLAPISSAGSVELIRRAKERGVPVTAGTTPHHLVAVDDDVQADDARWKTHPPLRTIADRDALRRAVRDGTIDVIFSDHAPLAREETDVEFDAAPFGISSLESALALLLHELVRPGFISLRDLVQRLSTAPARIFGVPGGTIAVGAPGDVTIIDLAASRTFDPINGYSMGHNTPFAGRTLTGWAHAMLVGGRLVMKDGRVMGQ